MPPLTAIIKTNMRIKYIKFESVRNEVTFLCLTNILNLYIHKLIRGEASEYHITRRLVTFKVPLSPLFPLVSSTESKTSMTNSPGLQFNCLKTL